MGVIIFFGFSAIFLTVSTIYVGAVVWHHYKLSRVGKDFHPENREEKGLHPS